jgi:hypothetical protein
LRPLWFKVWEMPRNLDIDFLICSSELDRLSLVCFEASC